MPLGDADGGSSPRLFNPGSARGLSGIAGPCRAPAALVQEAAEDLVDLRLALQQREMRRTVQPVVDSILLVGEREDGIPVPVNLDETRMVLHSLPLRSHGASPVQEGRVDLAEHSEQTATESGHRRSRKRLQ